ncbi:unnamed protein product, partial [Prorocentrum cordatum]
ARGAPPPGGQSPAHCAAVRRFGCCQRRTSGPPEPCSPSAAPPPSRAARSSTRSPAPRPCGRWGTTSPLTPGGPTLLAHGPRVGKADRDNNVDRTPTWARDQVGFGSLSLPMVTKRTGYKRGRPPRPSSEEGMAEEGEEEGGRRRGRH